MVHITTTSELMFYSQTYGNKNLKPTMKNTLIFANYIMQDSYSDVRSVHRQLETVETETGNKWKWKTEMVNHPSTIV